MPNRFTLALPLLLATVLPAMAQTPQAPAPISPFEQNIVDQFNALETVGRNAARASGDAARAAMANKAAAEQLQARVKQLEEQCGDKCKPPAPTAEAKPDAPAAPQQQ